MAEGALFSVAGRIINSLVPLIRDEIGRLWGVQSELKMLQNTVTTIKNVLQDAEKRKTGSQAISGWLEQLSDVLYEADDLLDAISTEAQRREIMTRGKKMKKVRVFFSKSNQLIYGLNMGHKIKEMKEKFDSIAADINNFRFLENAVETRVINRKREETYSSLGAEKIIGREGDKEAVINNLMGSNVEANVSIISIVGFGGLGKTALAKLIFNNEEIQKYFEVKIWVCVSNSFEVKDIIKEILEITKGEKPQTDLMEILLRDLKNEINEKKYLLVLDDVWNEEGEKWSRLNNQLMVGAKGSKILVTTRKEDVAKIIRSKEIHLLNGLEEQHSWELFKKMAFENEVVSGSLETMGKVILKKCRGVPLAIKTVGRLLYSESSERWHKFMKDELSTIDQEATDILPTLKLSYDDLSSQLKHCFAFCSLFPKDYIFDISTLITLWIANGYVESKGNQYLKEIGHEYFLDLLWRSFFQEVKTNDFGVAIKCKMHDLMHDLAISMARPLISTFPFEDGIDCRKIRHTSVPYDIRSHSVTLDSLYNGSMIQTFLCPTSSRPYVEIDCEAIVKSFEFLRVLDVSRRKLKCVPSSIKKLKHLRYLNLSYNQQIKKLPRSITMLVNLQYLYLSNCHRLIRFPKGFKRLVNLKHLDVGGCMSLRCMPDGMEQLTNLEKLNISGCDLLKELPVGIGQLTNLEKLNISGCDLLKELPARIGQLTNLEKLNISGCDLLKELPAGIGQLTNLEMLNISGCKLLKELPGDITKLVNLRFLYSHTVRFNYIPHGFGKLTNLQELSHFIVDSGSSSCDSSGLDELNGLNNLRGSLRIEVVSCKKNLAREYEAANLKDKQNLDSLEVSWGSGDDNDFDDDTLGSLQPHPNLKCLSLERNRCSRHPRWLLSLTNLVILNLNRCPKWQNLPPLGCLASLRILFLTQMDRMEYISNSEDWGSSSALFPSLKEIRLRKCPTLKGWWRNSPTEVESLRLSFPLLLEADIYDCPMLTSLPVFWHLKERLQLTSINWKPLQQTLMMNTLATSSAPSCTPLSKLKELEFNSIEDLEILLEEGLQNLTSLEKLSFQQCDKLKSLSPGVRHLIAVQKLGIYNCPMFVDDEDGMQWQGLKSLSSLIFRDLPKLSYLPPGLQYVTTLKELQIARCESLKTLSPVIQHLTTVEELVIEDCPLCVDNETGKQWKGLKSLLSLSFENLPTLSSLPLGLQHVTTLKELSIWECESLTTFSPVIQNLSALEELHIEYCLKCLDTENEMQLQSLQSLLSLNLNNLPKLSSLSLTFENLPKWSSLERLQQVTILKKLQIWNCESLTTIPDWLLQCKSLEELSIYDCSSLASLPVGMREPWSLKKLGIRGCPILLRKCEKGKGKYWPKIADIPELQLGRPPKSKSVLNCMFHRFGFKSDNDNEGVVGYGYEFEL